MVIKLKIFTFIMIFFLIGSRFAIHNSKSTKGIASNNKSVGIFLLNDLYGMSNGKKAGLNLFLQFKYFLTT